MYASAADALHRLLTGQEKECLNVSCHISRIPPKMGNLTNGIEHYSVEVTCENGAQFNIPAYGEEAEDLYREVLKSIKVSKPYAPQILVS